MPAAGEDHREPVFVGGGDDFRVAHRSAGLHDGGRAGGGDRVEPVAEREERIRCRHTAGERAIRPSSPRP